MDNVRGEEGRNGRPHNNSAGGRGRTQARLSFEGMNYEQKRRPYEDGDSNARNGIAGPGSDNVNDQRDNRGA